MKFRHRSGRARREDTQGKGLVTLEGRSEGERRGHGWPASPRKLEEARKPSPRPLQGSMPLPTPRFQTSGLQSCATVNLRFEAALSAALGSRHIRLVFLPCSDHHLPSHAFFSSAYPQHPHWHTSLGKPRPGLHHASVTRPGVYVFYLYSINH